LNEPLSRTLRRTGQILIRPWLLAFVGFFLLSAAWSFASPMSSAPDEPSHMVKAAATARGQFVNVTTRHEVQGGYEKYWLGYKLPAKYSTLDAMSSCFRFKPVSASCGKPFGTDDTETIVETSAGQSNPAYYYPVGLPSLFLPGTSALYGMRLMSALLNSGLLAGAVAVAARWRRPGWPMLGVLTCATPMVLFLNGTVNPNGMEASAAVLAWTAALSLTLDPRPELVTRRMILLAVSGALLANTRSLGVPWLASILLAAVVLGSWKTLGELVKRKIVWISGLVLVVGAVLGLLWNHYAATLTPALVSFPTLTPGVVSTDVFWTSGTYILQLVGSLGWLDTALPPGSLIAWYGALGLLALTGLGCARWREILILAVLVVGTVVIPIAAQVAEAKHFGIGWQGRYILAWAVGIPILAGLAVARRVGFELPQPLEFRVPLASAVIMALASAGAFYWSMIRYAHGGFRKYFPGPLQWSPPGGWLVSWLLFLVGAVALVVAITRRERVRAL
jgi:hypothetical protein